MKNVFIGIILLINFTIQAQTIIPGGYVSGTWNSAGSPYYIQDDILIHADSALIIESSTTLLFSSNKMLEIQGQLLVNGEPGDFVYFTGDQDTTTWYGLFFNTTDTSITDSSILLNADILHCSGHPCLTIDHSSRLRLNGCTIRYGDSFRGAGINCIYSDPYFEEILVEHHYALDGAGIALDHSSPTMINCSIYTNTAYGAGGGMAIFDASNPLLIHCAITGNQSTGSGGGVYINNANPVFRKTLINYNQGAIGGSNLYSGGGVSVKLGSHAIFENTIISDNISYREGGGIASFSENEFINCLFKNNYAEVKGGGAFLSSGNLPVSDLTNCTFADNDSPQGTAITVHNHDAVLRNCIVWHSNPSNPTSLLYLDSNLGLNVMNAGYSDIQGGEGGIELSGTADYIWSIGNIDLDPAFIPGDCDLSWQSPCINAGTPDTSGLNLPDNDLNGNPRLVNERVDMGAFEYQLPLSIPDSRFQIPEEAWIGPNPAKSEISIHYPEINKNEKKEILIFNAMGVSVLKRNITNSSPEFRIEISALPAGFYFVALTVNGNKIGTEKLVVID